MADKKITKSVEDVVEVEALAEIVEIVEPVKVAKNSVYVVQDGDTYASLGKQFAPLGTRGFLHAQYLENLNNRKVLSAGVEVKLNG